MKKYNTFDLLRALEDRNKKISSVFNDDCFLGNEISILWGIIEDEYGLEESDESADILSEFGGGNLTKQKAHYLLKKLKHAHLQ